MGASSRSVPAYSRKARVTVRSGWLVYWAASDARLVESRPAERNSPTGTSATIWAPTLCLIRSTMKASLGGVDPHRMAGGQRLDPAPDGEGLGDVAEQKKADATRRVDGAVDVPLEQRLDLRGDMQRIAVVVVIERLDADRIARQEQALLARIPDGEGIHAAEMLDHARPELVIGL